MFAFVNITGAPRMISLPRIWIVPSRPASKDDVVEDILFCVSSDPASTVR